MTETMDPTWYPADEDGNCISECDELCEACPPTPEPACIDGEQACALHLVLHGCAQSAVSVGTDFIEQSGYLPWAETNDIVLAFPQVVPGPLNPYACWDWWGYTGAEYRWRNGKQMVVVTDWINNL